MVGKPDRAVAGQRHFSRKGPSLAILLVAATIDSLMHASSAFLEDVASSVTPDGRSSDSRFSLRNEMRCCVSCRNIRRRLKHVCASSVKDVRRVSLLPIVSWSEDVRGVRVLGRSPEEEDVGLFVGNVLDRW